MRAFLADKNWFLVLLVAFAGSAGAKETSEALSPTMKSAYEALVNLQLLAASPEKFAAKESRAEIERDLERIAQVQHAFGRKDRKIDPGLAATVEAFSDYLHEARDEVKKGSPDYARQLIRTAGTFCMACHTRVSSPQDFEDVSRRIEKLPISKLRQGELFAATRQFDRAIGIYDGILDSKPDSAFDAVEFGRALRHFVMLSVRVKQDDEFLLSKLTKLSKRKDLPEFIRVMITGWQADAQFWHADKIPKSADLTGPALLRFAKRLIERGETLRMFPADSGGEISFLRATGFLHEALAKGLKGNERSEALYLLGVGYAALEEPSYSGLDLAFFEACIRENPGTGFAHKCYRRYLRAVLADPDSATENERKRLNALRKLLK